MTYHERVLAKEAPLEERRETARRHLAAIFRLSGPRLDGSVLDLDPDGAAVDALGEYYKDVRVLTLQHDGETGDDLARLAETVRSHEVGGVFALGTTLARAKQAFDELRSTGYTGVLVFSVEEDSTSPSPLPEFQRRLNTAKIYHEISRVEIEDGMYGYYVPLGEITTFD